MNRRTLLQSAAVSLGGGVLQGRAAASGYRNQHFPGTAFQPYCRSLPDYLGRLSRESLRLRDTALSQLTSASAITQRQAWVRESLAPHWRATREDASQSKSHGTAAAIRFSY